ncbi:MAG: hypothetical protein EA361_00100 [Bacteroidetes bacterium]|nr:MAG: hypothetical protein EA361_00100 [Bacteroidota bacterium]
MSKDIKMPEHVARIKESGLSVPEYCRQHGIPYQRMQYWIRKLRKVTANTIATNEDMFVELSCSQNEKFRCNTGHFTNQTNLRKQAELAFPGGLVLKIYG